MNPAIQKIGEFATIHLYNWMRDFAGNDHPYDDEEVQKLEQCWETLAEDVWKEDVFGAMSRLEDASFIEKTANAGKWLFKPYDLREKIFKVAEVTDKHWYKKDKLLGNKSGKLGLGLFQK